MQTIYTLKVKNKINGLYDESFINIPISYKKFESIDDFFAIIEDETPNFTVQELCSLEKKFQDFVDDTSGKIKLREINEPLRNAIIQFQSNLNKSDADYDEKVKEFEPIKQQYKEIQNYNLNFVKENKNSVFHWFAKKDFEIRKLSIDAIIEKRKKRNEATKKWRAMQPKNSIECGCGGRYTKTNKSMHVATNIHQSWVKSSI